MKNKKSLGQNWLKNREILEEIADLARYGADEPSAVPTSEITEAELSEQIGP